ncbi:MAG: S-methyl-5'-thioinosine phosphorylase [gamma proteobacterium symbiont of Bathyaustriella thionipta]|nr:S-methyl-5'-thioinosine phosphorylase [gamma proteobacterium symbiont of Bathyaustriella thionipta]
MTEIAIIGGSGFSRLKSLQITRKEVIHTPYGEASAPLMHGLLAGVPVVFLPRHGPGHTIPPHKINYRANIWALKSIEVCNVISVAAVGGITGNMEPGVLAVPDQIIDYTYGRHQTFFENDLTKVTHIDFTRPYCEAVRQALIQGAQKSAQQVQTHATYGAVQGPRLETAMEIHRMEQDGCDLVGMTGMPEAALAREFGLCYATLALVVNWAAGKSPGEISLQEIEANLEEGMLCVHRLMEQAVPILGQNQ